MQLLILIESQRIGSVKSLVAGLMFRVGIKPLILVSANHDVQDQ